MYESAIIPAAGVGAGFIPNRGARLGAQTALTGLRGAMSGAEAIGAGAFGGAAAGQGLAAGAATAAAPTAAAFSGAMAPMAILMAVSMYLGQQKNIRIEKGYIQQAKAALARFQGDPTVQRALEILTAYEAGAPTDQVKADMQHLIDQGMNTWNTVKNSQVAAEPSQKLKDFMTPLYQAAYKGGMVTDETAPIRSLYTRPEWYGMTGRPAEAAWEGKTVQAPSGPGQVTQVQPKPDPQGLGVAYSDNPTMTKNDSYARMYGPGQSEMMLPAGGVAPSRSTYGLGQAVTNEDPLQRYIYNNTDGPMAVDALTGSTITRDEWLAKERQRAGLGQVM